MRGGRRFIFALMLCVLASCSSNNTVRPEGESLYRILVGDKFGFMDENGRIVIEPQFDDAYPYFTEGVCYARIGKRRGLINRTGSFSMEFADSVRYVADFVNGYSRIDCGGVGHVGIISKNGSFVLPASYFDVTVNVDGESLYFCVEGRHDDNDWFIANEQGEMIGEKCDSILFGFHNGLCPVKRGEKWGYMDTSGRLAIDAVYDYVRTFSSEGLARVRNEGKWLYLNRAGETIFEVDKALTGFSCNRAFVRINGDFCLVNKHGQVVCTLDVDEVSSFYEIDCMAAVRKNGKTSKIDTLGNYVLTTDFESIGPFIGGVAPAKRNGKVGFIDINGNEIIGITGEEVLGEFHKEESGIRVVLNTVNDIAARSFYDLQGNLIWKDTPMSSRKKLPLYPNRKDCIEYFDSRLSELDPIEGIYYVTNKEYYQDRDNPSVIGLNDTYSRFYAVIKNDSVDGFVSYWLDDSKKHWVNKFVRIGETDTYAIMKIDKDSDYSSEGRITIEDFNQFDFKLDRGHNNYYNFFVTYEFLRDYPPLSEIEKIKKAEWTGSGFAIADGYIVTNYHVTSGAKSLRVKGVNGDMKKSYSGFVVASDKEHDISIVRIVDKDFDSFGSIPYTIGKAIVDVGDDVFVLGYPMTSTMGEEVKLTDGIISSSSGYKGDESMYQISAAVQPGNSGGPVFNSEGNIIGIVCGKHADAENANYAIKVSYLYGLITSSNLGFEVPSNNHINGKSLSRKVKTIKNYVYLIECSSK